MTHHRIAKRIALGITTAALSVGPVPAMADSGFVSDAAGGSAASTVDLRPDASAPFDAPSAPVVIADSADPSRAPGSFGAGTRPVSVKPGDPRGFDWGDAGIGAGGALAIVLLGTGGTLLAARRRGHGVASSGPSALAH